MSGVQALGVLLLGNVESSYIILHLPINTTFETMVMIVALPMKGSI